MALGSAEVAEAAVTSAEAEGGDAGVAVALDAVRPQPRRDAAEVSC